jgi:hypothetical protein
MSEYDQITEAAIARIGADRMVIGLSCIPHKIKGDLEEVMRLRRLLADAQKRLKGAGMLGSDEADLLTRT